MVTFEASLLAATCTLLADADGDAVVVDPGGGVADEVVAYARENLLRVRAVLATHGHVDHTWDAGVLCRAWGVPLVVHADDEYRLADPVGTLGPLGPQLVALAGLGDPVPPSPVRPLALALQSATALDLGLGEEVRAVHLPGHTEGSTVYLVETELGPTALTGDVLFAGTVGRTDLPGGSPALMAGSLAWLAALDPRTVVVPGHGPRTTIGAELRTNPYLRAAR
jgi:glyoxylase-like metal-dependent hydrolase (beta-lactamase superfamily II)